MSATRRKLLISEHANWQDWMKHWVFWDIAAQEYVGYAPDNTIIARQTNQGIFLDIFNKASKEWAV
jgi:hypothetical protein